MARSGGGQSERATSIRARLARATVVSLPRAWEDGVELWVVARDLAEKGHWAGAVVFYRQALTCVPDQWQWRFELCSLLQAAQRWDAALGVVDVRARNRGSEADVVGAAVLAQAGRAADARERLERACPQGKPIRLSPPGGRSEPSRDDPAAERLASALWHVGRHEELLQAVERMSPGDFGSGGIQPTVALARAWRLLLAGRAAEARSVLGPMNSYGVAAVGDIPVRFAHRGLHWIAELAFRGVRQAAEVLPRTDPPVEVPPTVEAALQRSEALDGWAALVVLGAGRDRDPHLASEALFTLGVRAAPRWVDLLRRLDPENSPARCCTARDEALAVARDQGPEQAEGLAARRAEAVVRRLAARRADRPSPEGAVAADLTVRTELARVAELQGAAVADKMQTAYAAEVQLSRADDPQSRGGQDRDGPDAAASASPAPQPTHADLRVKLLGNEAWRLLRLPLSSTLDDLHWQIQAAFEWDGDHLYAFGFGGSARRMGQMHGGPGTDEESAPGITLADLQLRPGRRFWYVFDFGDDHRFSVSVVAMGVHPGAADERPRLLKLHGDAPEQYPESDESW